MRSRAVASRAFVVQEIEKLSHGILFPVEMLCQYLPLCADPAPGPCQTGRSEQGDIDGQCIEARHVL